MSGSVIGERGPDRAEPSRTGFWDAAGGILVLLALGLIFRLIIAYLLPGSGFRVDLASFQYWASNLANDGLFGFYERPFFHDYTPGYLYVLWLVGGIGNLLGGIGDLIKVPPILGDLALGYLVWSMTRELGGSERAARIGALMVILNPVTWFDSVVWGQVDSVGVVFLLLALRELWRDRPERAAILATLAALVKPQLGILIPIVAIVVIRRAFWPQGGYGSDVEPEARASTTRWEERVRGPIRVVTTALAGLVTAIVVSWPFGLSFPGLIAQVFKTAAGYPYLSVNAFNPWALVIQTTADGSEKSIALNRAWVCDSTIVASPPGELRIGDWVIANWPASTQTCEPGLLIGVFPAALVGAMLFLIATAIVVWLVGRRPDRLTMLVGLAILALAFFVLPTRVHERYLFPLAAVGGILAAVSLRWRVAYVLSAAATFANMYVVLTTYYDDNPSIRDWLGMGDALASPWGVAIASLTQAAVFGWAFFQLREEAIEGIADGVAGGSDELDVYDPDDLEPGAVPDDVANGAPAPLPPASRQLPSWVSSFARPAVATEPGLPATGMSIRPAGSADANPLPVWDSERDAGSLGPWAWFRARLRDSPVRADRSRLLEGERGGRLDRLDAWVLVVLAISLLTVRMWRLDEPFQMHFDEVYHPRTATEFLQDWRYGQSHDIYEWTHPHLAKYAMALGLVAFGEDKVSATGRLGVAVVDAAVEIRRDESLDSNRIEGDRLWVVTGSEVRAYDLATRALAGTLALPDAVAVAYDRTEHTLYVGTRAGEIRVVDVGELDATRRGPPAEVESRAFMNVEGPIERLYLSRDGNRLVAVLRAGFGTDDAEHSQVVVIDATAALELSRPSLRGVGQITSGVSDDRLAVATADGVAFIEPVAGSVTDTLDVGGAVGGIVAINDIQDDPIYATVMTAEGPQVAVIIAKRDTAPRKDRSYTLPGARAGRAYFDLATRMVHVEGSVPAAAGAGASGAASAATIYVIEPHANAIYADAALDFVPVVMVLDENQLYPSSDRQQLLAFDASGNVASVEIGRHAYAWRVPGVIAGVLMALLLYVLARLLFKRRSVAVLLGLIVLLDGMLFAQSRIGMNDAYVGLGIVAAYTIFAALWLHPGNSRRHWVAFAIGVPLIGVSLGFALAAKWVAAYAIGGLGLLTLARSALGRLLLIAGLVVLTTALGYVAISVPAGASGGNYVFLAIMVALLIAAVLANILHPVAWTWEELRFAIGVPIAIGIIAILYGLSRGDATTPIELGSLSATPIELGLLAFLGAGALYVGFVVVGRFGFGPLAPSPAPDDPAVVLEPATDAPQGWLRLGSGWGLPAIWLAVGLLVIPIGLYVASYLPWAFVENHQIIEGWPAGHTGQTLLDLTSSMYGYHNNLSSAHPASSPWWAWAFDLKPVWFYEEGFAGRTSASIYDAGNLVAWWLAVPGIAFVAWQAFRRRSAALALIAIAFAVQWIAWSRIDRAAFQYHYYTALPFLFLALAYFLAELWHGTSRRIWLLARLSAAAAILGPFGLWLVHRPLCAIARVIEVAPDSRACPTLIPDVTIFGLEIAKDFPVEPIALFVTLALSPIAAYVATARDARRFVLGAIGAMVFWFVLWYPNISALPLPEAIHNAYQGFLPTYLYPFQFWVLQGDRAAAPSLFDVGPAVMLLSLAFMSVVIGYSAWSWRIALAERRRDLLARRDDAPELAAGAD